MTMSTPRPASNGEGPYLHLFGRPCATINGECRAIPDCGQHLLVWLALRRGRVDRNFAAGMLWPIVDDRRATGNLRSALWRLRGAGLELIEVSGTTLTLQPDVGVDVHVAADWAQRLIDRSPGADDLRVVPWFSDAIALLPGWADDWVILERERLRHRILHAFEELSRLLCNAGRYTEGICAARTLVAADPLRESAQRTLFQAYLSAGSTTASERSWQAYRRLHHRAFGVDPLTPARAALSSCDEHRADYASPAPRVIEC
jgi:DNA-binding SARP family transcriptional activator